MYGKLIRVSKYFNFGHWIRAEFYSGRFWMHRARTDRPDRLSIDIGDILRVTLSAFRRADFTRVHINAFFTVILQALFFNSRSSNRVALFKFEGGSKEISEQDGRRGKPCRT